MKIVFNTDQIFLHGGIEKVMATKANYFANQKDVEVYIVTTEQVENGPCYPLDKKIKLIDLGINYKRRKSYFSITNLSKIPLHFTKQKQLLKRLKPDIIISPNYNFDHYWLPFIKNKAKLIKERHSSRFFEQEVRNNAGFLKKIKIKIDDYIDSLYDKIVVLNHDEKKYVKSNNTVVIPNPFEPTTLRADITQQKVIAAGRISQVKGFDQLIKAWALIYPEFPTWQLHFYGQDYLGMQKKLENLVSAHQLDGVIKFMGSTDNLLEAMTTYSIYAMTSETECFPMVLLESMSVGLPIVSYDCPNGPRNILRDRQDSFVVPDRNLKIFAEKLKLLMKDQNLRQQMGATGVENVQRFSLKEVMVKWQKLFELLLG